MKLMAALALAFALANHDAELEQEFARTQSGSPHALITLIAQYEDGTPLRGYISCAGYWFKYQDDEMPGAQSYPFRTDSRGAIVMNPNIGDEWIVCSAEQNGYRGTVTVDFSEDHPRAVRVFILRKDS